MEPVGDYEELEIRALDGTSIRAFVAEPVGAAVATIIVVPSLRALATDLARRGYRALTFAGRPHAHLEVVIDCVRDRADGHPVIALGPSELVLSAKADSLVFFGGALWRGLKATLTTATRLPVAQVLGRFDLPLAKLTLGPTHVVRTEGNGERAYSAIARAVDWARGQAR